MRVIGTAGHVDHGKSTLVRALSGIDPDRLREEKARGMTIDLGFAWIDLPVLAEQESADTHETVGIVPAHETVGIVDVPGHIDFIKNMLAGVGGIDAAVLVIAADEGVMPQTREHLAILDLLGVPAGVVALTKVDLIDDPEWLDLVELDVAELLEETRLADAPVIRASAVTGAGWTTCATRWRPRWAGSHPGAVPGRARPSTESSPQRVRHHRHRHAERRSLCRGRRSGDSAPQATAHASGVWQSHNQAIQQGEPGSRLAINLTGVSTDDIHRGDVVVKPDTLHPTTLIDAAFRLLPGCAQAAGPQPGGRLLSSARDGGCRGRRARRGGDRAGTAGCNCAWRSSWSPPAGDRFIPGQPSMTLGGGTVLSPDPRRRWKRFDPRHRPAGDAGPGRTRRNLLQTLARQIVQHTADLIGQSGLDVAVADEALDAPAGAAVVPLGDGDPLLVGVDMHAQMLDPAQRVGRVSPHQPLRRGMARRTAQPGADPVRAAARARLQRAAGAGRCPRRGGADEALAWRRTSS
ncbi:MAG: GTP-binding protein [Caldilineaceae bacterium]